MVEPVLELEVDCCRWLQWREEIISKTHTQTQLL